MAAYIDGGLDARQRADVEKHLAGCTDCSEWISEVLRVQEAIPDVRPDKRVLPGRFGRRKVVWTMSGLLAIAAALMLVVRLLPASWTGRVDPKLADLVDAVGEQRTVEARLAGGFHYGPFRSPVRSGGRSGSKDNWALLAAAGRIREAAERDNSPANLHALGVASLLVDDWDAAVRALEDAVSREAGEPRYASDLAAAYLARGTGANRASDLAQALELLDRTDAPPSCVECRFNRALALELMHLTQDAIAAWDDYLTVDPSSPWAAEARSRRDALIALRDRPVSDRSPVPNVPCLRELQLAQDSNEVSQLRDLVATCERELGSHASIEQRGWLGLFAGISGFYTGNYAVSDEEVDRLLAADAPPLSASLRGRLYQLRGALRFARADYQAGLAAVTTASQLLGSPEDRPQLASIFQSRAAGYAALGQRYEMWRDYRRSLELSVGWPPSTRRHSLQTSIGIAALASGMPHLALRVLTLAENGAAVRGHAGLHGEALLLRARALAAVGDTDRADADLESAASQIAKANDPALRTRLLADLNFARGEIFGTRRPQRAIEAAEAAIDYYSRLSVRFRQASLQLTIAQSHLALGHRSQAAAALQAGIALIESEQAKLEERRLRVSHLDRTWDLYRDAIEMAVEDGDAEGALGILERQRGRMSRLEALGTANASRVIRPDTLALVYLQTPTHLLRWAISSTGIAFTTTPVTAAQMATLVSDFRDAVAAGRTPSSADRTEGALSGLLLGGLDAELGRATQVAVVPDGAIGDIPFGALRTPEVHIRLAQRWSTATYPSLGHALRPRGPTATPTDTSVVVVVPPPPLEGDLRRLIWAPQESESVARLYGRAEVLDGVHATPTAMSAALGRADVVHFAGHAVADAANPWRSRLLLAADAANPSGGWSTAEIADGKIRAVAVLAACSTAEGAYRRGVGVISLASEMLAAGAPAVVATLWDIPDDEAAPIFTRLHSELRKRSSASEAVRAVQAASDVSATKWALVAFGN